MTFNPKSPCRSDSKVRYNSFVNTILVVLVDFTWWRERTTDHVAADLEISTLFVVDRLWHSECSNTGQTKWRNRGHSVGDFGQSSLYRMALLEFRTLPRSCRLKYR